MGVFNWLGIGKEISQPIEAIGGLYTTDKERIEAEAKLQDVLQKPQLAQIESNKLMIATGRMFSAGWIALLGWTSGFLIFLFYAPQIVITTYIWSKICITTMTVTPFPMSPDNILNLVYLLFGTGTLHIFKNKK